VEGDFLKLSTGAAGALGLPAFDAAFDRGGLVAVEPSDRSVKPIPNP
jgi:thiopurine S-methyltransferase